MSSRRLPDRPSLEQLRKQAKEHLEALRAADPAVHLSAAQHALAREYGFESWPKLVRHVDVEGLRPANRMLQPAELKTDDKLMWSAGRGSDVWALIQASASGDSDTVRRLIAADPSLQQAWHNKGMALLELGETRAAYEALGRALALAPHDVMARLRQGYTAKLLGRTEEARTAFRPDGSDPPKPDASS